MRYTIELEEHEFYKFKQFKETTEDIEYFTNQVIMLESEYSKKKSDLQIRYDLDYYSLKQRSQDLQKEIEYLNERRTNTENELKEQRSKLKEVNGFYKPAFWVIVILIVLGFLVDKLGA